MERQWHIAIGQARAEMLVPLGGADEGEKGLTDEEIVRYAEAVLHATFEQAGGRPAYTVDTPTVRQAAGIPSGESQVVYNTLWHLGLVELQSPGIELTHAGVDWVRRRRQPQQGGTP